MFSTKSALAISFFLLGAATAARGGQLFSRAELQEFFGGPGIVEDFETFDINDGTQVNIDCSTLNAAAICNGQGPGLVDSGIDVTFGTGPGDWLGPGGFDGGPSKDLASSGQPLVVDFTAVTYAFGVDVRNGPFFAATASVDVYGADDATLLGSVEGIDLSSGNPVFVGWSDPGGIGKVEFRQTQPWSPAIDNLEFGPFKASSQVTYEYVGNTFTLFSCGSTTLCSTPAPGESSYTTDNFVRAFIRLDEPLPPGLVAQEISGFSGFSLIMSDGQQHFSFGGAEVSTDSDGEIIAPWFVHANGPVPPNNGTSTVNWPDVRGVGDVGALSAPTGSTPDTPFDIAWVFSDPGSWTKSVLSPETMTSDLIVEIEGLVETFQLKKGQANGLTRPLENVLRSIEKGKTSPACSQLQDFIDQVNAKTPEVLLVPTAEDLIASADAVRESLGCVD